MYKHKYNLYRLEINIYTHKTVFEFPSKSSRQTIKYCEYRLVQLNPVIGEGYKKAYLYTNNVNEKCRLIN